MQRPRKWSKNKSLLIRPSNYNMKCVRNFVNKSLLGISEIKQIKVKKRFLEKTNFTGLCLFECNEIFIADDIAEEEKYITVLHEIFHYYFRDYQDYSNIDHEDENDPIEIRAEKSAKNMLQWYKTRQKEFDKFKLLVDNLSVSELTKEDYDKI